MRERKGGAWTRLLLMKARKPGSRLPVGVLERNHVTAGYSNPLGGHGWSASCPRGSTADEERGWTSASDVLSWWPVFPNLSKTPSERTAIRCAMLASCFFAVLGNYRPRAKGVCAHAMRDALDVNPCSLLLSAPYVRRRIASQGLATGVC